MLNLALRKPRLTAITALIWLAAILLLIWVLRTVPLRPALEAITKLTAAQIAILLVGNALIITSFAARWWLILRAMGRRIPYLPLASYRFAAFGINYFTPGSQFGGEPLQVALIHRRHTAPLDEAAASVALEKLLELVVNFAVLAAGIAITVPLVALDRTTSSAAFPLALLLLSLPVAFLSALSADKRPLGVLAARLPMRGARWTRFAAAIAATEAHAAALIRRRPLTLLEAVGVSVLNWAGILAEIWLMAYFLGVPLTAAELVAVVTASRIAILTPSPGGLGTLEASQVAMFGWLGFDPSLGLSLALLVRLRDVLFAGVGLAWGAVLLPTKQG